MNFKKFISYAIILLFTNFNFNCFSLPIFDQEKGYLHAISEYKDALKVINVLINSNSPIEARQAFDYLQDTIKYIEDNAKKEIAQLTPLRAYLASEGFYDKDAIYLKPADKANATKFLESELANVRNRISKIDISIKKLEATNLAQKGDLDKVQKNTSTLLKNIDSIGKGIESAKDLIKKIHKEKFVDIDLIMNNLKLLKNVSTNFQKKLPTLDAKDAINRLKYLNNAYENLNEFINSINNKKYINASGPEIKKVFDAFIASFNQNISLFNKYEIADAQKKFEDSLKKYNEDQKNLLIKINALKQSSVAIFAISDLNALEKFIINELPKLNKKDKEKIVALNDYVTLLEDINKEVGQGSAEAIMNRGSSALQTRKQQLISLKQTLGFQPQTPTSPTGAVTPEAKIQALKDKAKKITDPKKQEKITEIFKYINQLEDQLAKSKDSKEPLMLFDEKYTALNKALTFANTGQSKMVEQFIKEYIDLQSKG